MAKTSSFADDAALSRYLDASSFREILLALRPEYDVMEILETQALLAAGFCTARNVHETCSHVEFVLGRSHLTKIAVVLDAILSPRALLEDTIVAFEAVFQGEDRACWSRDGSLDPQEAVARARRNLAEVYEPA